MTDISDNQADRFNERQKGHLPGHLGIHWTQINAGRATGSYTVAQHHMAPNGFMHAGGVVTLADTACGYGCVASLPDGASGFTTLELKTNFMGTTREGTVACEAKLLHGGRATQVWDAEVRHVESGRVIAAFRCTQMILYPRT